MDVLAAAEYLSGLADFFLIFCRRRKSAENYMAAAEF